jgi:predicted GNAT family acetyltransferase
MERYFIVQNGRTMQRMVVDKETFRPAEGMTRRITGSDIGLVNRLYSSEGSYYSARHLDESVYYATLENDRLVSIAGTHIVAPNEGIAVVGNVYTHPRYRGRGYATQATSAVTAELLDTCSAVALTVDPKNLPAVRAYEKLGYRPEGALMESMVYRKDLIGVGSFVRRLLVKKETV